MSHAARNLVNEVLSRKMTREVWADGYKKVLPVNVLHFDLSAVLPAVFYMFRFGHRRGRGRFLETYGPREGTLAQRRRKTTVEAVASALVQDANEFDGFADEVEKAILGDLLLCFCLENRSYEPGRVKPVQRVAPTHYMASWIDLPDNVANLRFVPETIVAILANQENAHIHPTSGRTWFPVVGTRGKSIFEKNILLKAMGPGMAQTGALDNYDSDHFHEKESTTVGLDQLLSIRLAQRLGSAPKKLRGADSRISNQRPIASRASKNCSEDIRRFVRDYALSVPRHAFVEMFESCIAVGLTTIFTSVAEIVLEWKNSGKVEDPKFQRPARLFVDCSSGVDRRLRNLAEQSMDDYMRRIEPLPVAFMVLRLLDYRVRYDRKIRKELKSLKIEDSPQADEWIEFLGDVLHGRHARADFIWDDMESDAESLAEDVREDYPRTAHLLQNEEVIPNPVLRLAEGIVRLQGRVPRERLYALVGSLLYVDRPNGLAKKRRTRRMEPGRASPRSRQVRSVVLTDAVLEYLVHSAVLPAGRGRTARTVSLAEFMNKIKKRYGFYVDAAPPGLTVSNELLQQNRSFLERRLRDLGLMIGVNDAEAMKRLKPRFQRRPPHKAARVTESAR